MTGIIVNTKNGYVKGTRTKKCKIWRGLPYAKAPVGSLRFAHAVPRDN